MPIQVILQKYHRLKLSRTGWANQHLSLDAAVQRYRGLRSTGCQNDKQQDYHEQAKLPASKGKSQFIHSAGKDILILSGFARPGQHGRQLLDTGPIADFNAAQIIQG